MSLIHKIGLGSVQFGLSYGIANKDGQTSETEAAEILKCAHYNQINLIDTAAAYGNAEERLGRNNLDGFDIVSKFMPSANRQTIGEQLDRTLTNLNVSSLYAYLAHRPLNLLEDRRCWSEVQQLKEAGKIKKIGYSLNSPHELDLLLKKNIIPDIVQVPYNYFDNRFYDQLIKLKYSGCEVHTRSAFLQGLFFADVNVLPAFFNSVKPLISLLQIQFKNNLSGALLKYVLSFDFIDRVIIGVQNKEQLIENLNSINQLSDLKKIDNKISDMILMPSNWPTN